MFIEFRLRVQPTWAHLQGEYRFADNFVVPPGGWTLSAVRVYAYQPGVVGPASPFSGLTLRIWLGQPGQPGSFVLWGDETTNRMSSSTSTGVYRVFNTTVLPLPSTPDTTRLIFETRAQIAGLYLGEGSYWLDWQYTSINANGGAFSPAATLSGSRGTGNAMQYRAAYGSLPAAWVAVTDGGKPAQAADVGQDLPFRIEGVGGQVCDPDVNCDFALDGFDVEVQELAVGGDMTDYCQADPDFNRDFALDGFDVEAIEVAVGGGPCP